MSSPSKYKKTFDASKLETIKTIQAFVGETTLQISFLVISGSGDAVELDPVVIGSWTMLRNFLGIFPSNTSNTSNTFLKYSRMKRSNFGEKK